MQASDAPALLAESLPLLLRVSILKQGMLFKDDLKSYSSRITSSPTSHFNLHPANRPTPSEPLAQPQQNAMGLRSTCLCIRRRGADVRGRADEHHHRGGLLHGRRAEPAVVQAVAAQVLHALHRDVHHALRRPRALRLGRAQHDRYRARREGPCLLPRSR